MLESSSKESHSNYIFITVGLAGVALLATVVLGVAMHRRINKISRATACLVSG
jgi:hypothetical protein